MSGQHIVIVTGGRSLAEEFRPVVYHNLHDQLLLHGPFILFHGACTRRGSTEMTGADRYADDWAQLYLTRIDPDLLRRRPADWSLGSKGGPTRNKAMVLEAAKLAPPKNIHGFAFPEPSSRGTWNCVGYMSAHDIRCDVWSVERSREWLAAEREGAH